MLKDRFLKYVSFDTQSSEESSTFPSTLKQLELAKELVNELKELGISNAFLDEFGYVYGILEGKINKKIGLISHMDTALEMPGKDVKPNIIEKYDGKDIKLPNGLEIKIEDFPFLASLKGDTLITTSGDTLLGADDKAGIAIIMTLLEKLIKEQIPHPTIYVCFTPDEEVGMGTEHFNYDFFKVDFAYTLDGGLIDEINYENFNAASLKVEIQGNTIHPGSAKNKLINSMEIAHEFHSMLPKTQKPEYTEKYEGFFHLTEMFGEVQFTTLKYIIRDHDINKFNQKKQIVKDIESYLNKKYGVIIKITINDSYLNMAELINKHPEILFYPEESLKKHNINAKFIPIRGGTDGARLSYGGILTPNLGTGSFNHHGAREIADVNQMNTQVEVLFTMLTKVIK